MSPLITLFRALADATRIRLLALVREQPQCVEDLAPALAIRQPKASRHLAYLRRRGMVSAGRAGNLVEYSLPAKRTKEVQANLEVLERFARGVEVYQRDLAELEGMRGKNIGQE